MLPKHLMIAIKLRQVNLKYEVIELSSEADLTVDVSEYKTCGETIKNICNNIDDLISILSQKLKNASENGVQSGETAEKFAEFSNILVQLNGELAAIGKKTNKLIGDYLEDIDKNDDKLFKNSGYKPFTDEEFEACFSVVKNTTEPGFDIGSQGFWTRIWDFLLKFFWWLADYKVTADNSQSILKKKVKNLKEQTAKKITSIKTNVRLTDRQYRRESKNLLELMVIYKTTLEKFYQITASGDGNIDGDILNELSSLLKKYKDFEKSKDKLTDIDVKNFADNVTGYFSSSTELIGLICEESIGTFVTTEYDRYRSTVKEALEYFNSVSTGYTISHEKYKEYKDEFDSMLSYYNQYGADWLNYYTGDSEKAALFNKIAKSLEKISNKSDDYIDIWFKFFCDMSESKTLLNSFISSCDIDNKNVNKALQRIKDIYDKDIEAYIMETWETFLHEAEKLAIKNGTTAFADAYSKIFPGGGMKSLITRFLSTILDKAYSESPAVAQYDWVVATETYFNDAVAKLKAASPDDPNYKSLVDMVKKTFDCAKKARIKFFETMIAASSGDRKEFYELNLKSIKNMSLEDVSPHSVTTPGDYFGGNGSIIEDIFDGNITVEF